MTYPDVLKRRISGYNSDLFTATDAAAPIAAGPNATDIISVFWSLPAIPSAADSLASSPPSPDGNASAPLPSTKFSDQNTSATDASVALTTTDVSMPAISVNAANPADVVFTVSGLPSDYSGKVTFTDTNGKADVVPISGNRTYSANLSNLANGTLTYLMTVSNPAGNVINVDPTATLGDGSANAPSGPAQLPNLLNGYAARPSWYVAGVDYAVGYGSTSLTDWRSINQP